MLQVEQRSATHEEPVRLGPNLITCSPVRHVQDIMTTPNLT